MNYSICQISSHVGLLFPYLLNQNIGIVFFTLSTVGREPVLIKLEFQAQRIHFEGTVADPLTAKLLRQIKQDLDVMADVLCVVLRNNRNATQRLAIKYTLRIMI